MTQAYMHRYKNKVTVFDKNGVEEMLKIIINDLSDYTRTKTWEDINFDSYNKYFYTDLTAYPDIPLNMKNKVHGINLTYIFTKRKTS